MKRAKLASRKSEVERRWREFEQRLHQLDRESTGLTYEERMRRVFAIDREWREYLEHGNKGQR